MERREAEIDTTATEQEAYILDGQVGFLMRQAQQRHASLFAECFGDDLTPMQWAVIAKLAEIGACSQNLLGRYTAMDVATIKGVVERLNKRKLLLSRADPDDRRRVMISLSPAGRRLYERHLPDALRATEITLKPLRPGDRATLVRLLKQLR